MRRGVTFQQRSGKFWSIPSRNPPRAPSPSKSGKTLMDTLQEEISPGHRRATARGPHQLRSFQSHHHSLRTQRPPRNDRARGRGRLLPEGRLLDPPGGSAGVCGRYGSMPCRGAAAQQPMQPQSLVAPADSLARPEPSGTACSASNR